MKTEKNILIAFILNILFSIFELIGGILTNSIAIISDAIHDFGDAISIGISYFLENISKKKPDNKYTYGYKRYSLLGAIITNIILIVGSTLVTYNAILRLINPTSINYNGMIIFAIFGTLINFIAAYITKEGNSLNQKAVNFHMLEDVLGWIIVLIGAIVMKFTNISILDSILSILVSLFIFKNAFKNFLSILNIFLEKTPKNISIDKIKKELLKLENIKDIHHIHIWTIDGYTNYATMHIVSNNKNIKNLIREELLKFNISHVTLEIETEKEQCKEEQCNIKQKDINKHHHH